MAEIKYKISGKSDTTAIAKTQLAMKKLGSEVVNLNKIVSGFAIAKVMQVVSKVTSGATENFLAQNKALQQYNATVAKFGKSLSNLNKIQNEVSRNNFFDGDSINNATKMAVAMGLTEKQIEDVLKASTDLAASGVMPLDQAVKALSRSYSGNLEELKRMNPELANLTKEQLAQGEAVRIIGQEYKGMADAMANTFEGRDTQWKNSFSDLQAEVGEIIQRVKYFGQGVWLDPINRLSNWLNDNSAKIAAFIVTLPENFKIAAVAIKDIVKEIFSIDFWAKNGEVIVEIFKETFIAAKDVATAIMVALMKSLAELVKVVAVNMGKSLVSGLFGNLGSFGIEALYRANVIDYDTRANLLNKLDDKVSSLDNAIENWQKENKVTLEGALNNVKSSWKDVGKTISDSVKATHKTVSGLSQEIDSSIGDIVSKATRDINDNVTENISNVEPSQEMTNPTTVIVDNKDNKDNNNNNNNTQQQQSVWAQWKLSTGNLFNTLFPKMADKIENLSANVVTKIIDDKLNVLKSADVYKGIDHKDEIEVLSNVKDALISFTKGTLWVKGENGGLVRGEKASLTRALDVALGSMAVAKYNKKHNTNIPVFQPLTGFIKSLIQVLDMTIFDKITKVFVKDEAKRMEIYKAIKDFTKSTREVFNKLSADLFTIVGNTLMKSSGQIGNYINAGMQGASNGGGFYGALLAVIAQLLSDIMQVVSENSEKFQAFQNLGNLILESLLEQILPIFDNFVTPFLEGFTAVKELISGIIYLLGSIIGIFAEIFKEFTRELNITASTVSGIFKFIGGIFQIIRGFIQFMQPVMNALSYVTKVIATAIYTVEYVIVKGINAIIWALNQLPFVDINEISGFDDYNKAISDIWNGENSDEDNAYLNNAMLQSASNITGSSASYTAARDIYVTIEYNNSYVNGDARAIALNLYNELKDCKKLNLIA